MRVLSLFDGMSCGQLALKRSAVYCSEYFASEIDKSAIDVCMKNFPNTIQLGDVQKIENFPGRVDLLLGGSPCTNFSFAGHGYGITDDNNLEVLSLEHYLYLKERRTVFKGQSYLFWEFVRIATECFPKYFLLENVGMSEKWENVITKAMGVEPLRINSSLVSAQDRKRLYWTNIPITGISNRYIYFFDILDDDADESLYLSDEIASRYKKSKYRYDSEKSCVLGTLSKYQGDRVFNINAKASSLSASGGNNGGGGCNIIFDRKTGRLRRLSVTECERLQTVPEEYTASAKKTARYKMLGNGWTVDVISEILKGIHQ